MKKYLYLLFTIVALISFSCSETEEPPVDPIVIPPIDCYYRGPEIHLTTQAEVDAFAALHYCRIIDVDLYIGSWYDNSNITSLAGLSTITKTNGRIRIMNNPLLTSLQGLHNIKGASSYEIKYNNSLVNLNGIGQVTTIADATNYTIIGNTSLQNLQGFENIQYINNILIIGCPNFSSLQGLENCKNIESLEISSCPMVSNLNYLSSLKYINSLNITESHSFTSLQGLDNLETINSMKLENNHAFSSFAGLNSILDFKSLECIKNPSLTNMEGLENITKLDNLSIEENSGLVSLLGLQNLTEISHGGLRISNNVSLTNITDLSSLVKIAGYYYNSNFYGALDISYNPQLTSLDGLQNVTTFNGGLSIYTNTSLTDLCPLMGVRQNGNIQYVSFHGNANPVTFGNLNTSNCN